MTTLTKLTITEAKAKLLSKEISSVELVDAHLQAIEKNKHLNAFVTFTPEIALTQARQADKNYATGKVGLLEGIPVAVKDLYCTKGVLTTACSKILHNFVPTYESTVTTNMFAQGAVMTGKVNMDEFAMGSATIHSYFGKVISPIKANDSDADLVAGGSSGGSSATVAADLSMAALGSDTGGSVRQPASYTGTVGVKPTYGRCSRYGMIAFASSLDQAGLLAKNVEDSALVLQSIMGHDKNDSTTLNLPVPNLSREAVRSGKKLVIGIPKEYNMDGMPTEISKLWEKGAKAFADQGAEIREISLPHTEYALACYYIVACAEASSNLARYDGVRFGLRVQEKGMSLDEMYEATRGEGFGAEVKRRIMLGTYVLSAGYYDAYYGKAQMVRRKLVEDFRNAFKDVDVLLTPTTPSPAFKIGEKMNDPVQMYLNDIFTVPSSMAGLPVISLPSGFSSNQLPLGLQLIANQTEEQKLYEAAYSLEEALGFDRSAIIRNVKE